MKRYLSGLSSVLIPTLVLSACSGTAPRLREPVPPDPTIAIIRANLWDGTGRAPVTNAVTLVQGDRIICAGAAGECIVPPRARVIDAHGQWLIPGLIDSHVHLLFLTGASASEELASTFEICSPKASPPCGTWEPTRRSCSGELTLCRLRHVCTPCSW